MQAQHQLYLNNLAAARRLVKPQFAAGTPEDEVIASIRAGAGELFRLHRENDGILSEILFSKTADALTEEEAADLRELADALFNFTRSADVGIAYRIHQLLYAYAERQGDLDGMVRELYLQGITLFYINVREPSFRVNLFRDKIGACFEAGAAYFDRFEQLQNPETRGYIIRCMGNVKYGLPMENLNGSPAEVLALWRQYLAVFDRTMAVLTDPHYREMDPEIPWESFCYAMHYDRTQFLTVLRDADLPEIAAGVLESAEYVYHHQEHIAAHNQKAVGVRTRYVYAAARYHAGALCQGSSPSEAGGPPRLPLEDLVDVLYGICAACDPDDHSADGVWANLAAPEYLRHYAMRLDEAARQSLQPRLAAIADRRVDYLFRLPITENAGQVSHLLQSTVQHASKADDLFSDRVLHYFLACHPPTYVHSKVVGDLSRWFCARFAEVDPARLEGLFGIRNAAEKAERPPNEAGKGPLTQPGSLAGLLEQAYRAGLYHDAGKSMLLSYVGQYSRRLLDEEFACIKLHPQFGCSLLENLGLADHACAAHYHHRSYNRRGGYPGDMPDCPLRAKLMVDIITVVDALDAGTDNVGRSYAAAKTFEQLVEELRAGKGTRYAPAVVELLDDPGFYEATKQFLAQSRRKAYVNAYCGQDNKR